MRPRRDLPPPFGATLRRDGVDFAFYAGHADGVEVVLFDEGAPATAPGRTVRLEERAHGTWFGFVPGIGAGQRYALRVQGPWRPAEGLRHNHDKLVLDPYARAVEGDVTWRPEVFGHWVDDQLRGDPDVRDGRDSAPYMPRCVVVADRYDWEDDVAPQVPWTETLIYETHVRSLTRLHPDVPEELRGTYAGLAHPAALKHLRDLGVTTVELLPVQAFTTEPALVQRGLVNYWGYNTLGFFAPHAPYAAATGPQAVLDEFKDMVKALHREGLEVILDVVYNHTAEGNEKGPTLSFRGLDNSSYYRLVDGDWRHYYDTTGTGNSLLMRHPYVLQLIMDSLRYWVTEMHVDGFRFDLAATLARQFHEVDRLSAFFDLIQQDPVISRVKLIAEPWDLGEGGYQVGNFPQLWSEWNGLYRDAVRDFWRGEDHTLGDFASRLTGSSDLYAHSRRHPRASVNFVTAHDGFTLRDLVSYNDKHNEANGEGNRDGESANRSWNCGAEGATRDPAVLELRARQQRNFLATLLLSQGIPMLSHGDELGRTQHGNNNAYCQDNEISWMDWRLTGEQRELLDFTRALVSLRLAHPVLRRRRFFRGQTVRHPGQPLPDLVWLLPDAHEMTDEDWRRSDAHSVGVFLNGDAIAEPGPRGRRLVDDSFLLLLNSHWEPVDFRLPHAAYGERWTALIDTTDPEGTPDEAEHKAGTTRTVGPRSLVLLSRPSRTPS